MGRFKAFKRGSKGRSCLVFVLFGECEAWWKPTSRWLDCHVTWHVGTPKWVVKQPQRTRCNQNGHVAFLFFEKCSGNLIIPAGFTGSFMSQSVSGRVGCALNLAFGPWVRPRPRVLTFDPLVLWEGSDMAHVDGHNGAWVQACSSFPRPGFCWFPK